MSRKWLIGAAVALGTVAMTVEIAEAQRVCGKRNEIVKRLESGYQESVLGLGVSKNGMVVELYTSEKGTWTLVISDPNGISCLIDAGDHWEQTDKKKGQPT